MKKWFLSECGVAAAALLGFAAILLMTMHINSQWTGQTIPEQLYEAVFVTKDWE